VTSPRASGTTTTSSPRRNACASYVKPVRGQAGIWEMTWEGNDGRATFMYGPEKLPGKRHVIWLRVGGHEIFQEP
jgi:hypothetical protein